MVTAPNVHVTDVWITFEDGKWEKAYGPEQAKAVARTLFNPGSWVMQNSDNLSLFAMSLMYQEALNGEYPSRPFAQDLIANTPRLHKPYSIFNYTDGFLDIGDPEALNQAAVTTDPTTMSCLADTPVVFSAKGVPFAKDSDFPEDYQSSLSSWHSTWDAYWATASASATDTPPTDVPSVPTDSAQPAPAAPTATSAPAPVGDECNCSYKVLFDEFEVQGKNFSQDDLKKQLDGCGLVTDYKVEVLTNDPDGMQFKATGRLPIGTKACVGRAVQSAGGNTADKCTGAG